MLTRAILGLMVGLALVAFATGAEEGNHRGGEITPIPTTWEKIQGDLAIWTAVVFLVLVVILWKFAWGPLARGLDKREQGIADQIAQAEHSNREAQELLAQYEKKLADSQDQVRGIIDQGKCDAELLGQELLETAKREAEAERQRALEEIDAATANALKELAGKSADLAVNLAGRIVLAELRPDDHARLIERAVSGFADKSTGNRP